MFGKFESSHLIIKEIMVFIKTIKLFINLLFTKASAKSLVNADRVSLFLLDKDTGELSARIFDKGNFEECIFETKENEIRFVTYRIITNHSNNNNNNNNNNDNVKISNKLNNIEFTIICDFVNNN